MGNACEVVIEARDLWRSFRSPVKRAGGPINTPSAIMNFIYRKLRGQRERVTYALRGITFTVRRSDFVLLVGPNGSGKTTLLKILAGILPYTRGQLRVLGDDPYSSRSHLREVRRRVSLIPNVMLGNVFFDPALSVEENLTVACELLRLSPKRALEMARLLDVKRYLSHRFGALSTGLAARAILALHLAKEAEIYLFDEPAVALSPEGRASFKGLLRKLREEGRTVIYATHYPSELVELFDKVLVLQGGRLVFYGALEDFTDMVFKGKDVCVEITLRGGFSESQLARDGFEVIGGKARAYCSSAEAFRLLRRAVAVLREEHVRDVRVIPRSFEEAYRIYVGAAT